MAIELIGTIKPKNGGGFPMVEAPDVAVGDKRLPEVIQGLQKTMPIVQMPPEGGVLESGTLYFLGEIEGDVALSFPPEGDLGEMIYLTFRVGERTGTVTIDPAHTAGLDGIRYWRPATHELMAMWNGVTWGVVLGEL